MEIRIIALEGNWSISDSITAVVASEKEATRRFLEAAELCVRRHFNTVDEVTKHVQTEGVPTGGPTPLWLVYHVDDPGDGTSSTHTEMGKRISSLSELDHPLSAYNFWEDENDGAVRVQRSHIPADGVYDRKVGKFH